MSKVYVIQIPQRGGYKLDISGASEFGALQEPCFLNQADISQNPEEIMESLYDYFQDFRDGDFILQAGEHTLFSAACVVASNYVEEELKVLKWDRDFKNGKRSGGYYSEVKFKLS